MLISYVPPNRKTILQQPQSHVSGPNFSPDLVQGAKYDQNYSSSATWRLSQASAIQKLEMTTLNSSFASIPQQHLSV